MFHELFIDKLIPTLIESLQKGYEANETLYIILFAILFIYLAIAAYIDFKSLTIPNKLNMLFFVIFLIFLFFLPNKLDHVYGALLGFFLLFIPAFIRNQPMGGDIKMSTVLGLYLGVKPLLLLFFIVFLSALTFVLVRKFLTPIRKDFAFAPFFFGSYLIMFIILVAEIT